MSHEASVDEWELLSEPSSACADDQAQGLMGGEVEGTAELFLTAEDSAIQPLAFGRLTASSEGSCEAADRAWCGAAAGVDAGVERAASAPLELASPASSHDSSCHQRPTALLCDSLLQPDTPPARRALSASAASLTDSAQSVASVQLRLVRAGEHEALKASLIGLEKRAAQREHQLATTRARLAAREEELDRANRECRVLRRSVAVLACSFCAMVGLHALCGRSRPLAAAAPATPSPAKPASPHKAEPVPRITYDPQARPPPALLGTGTPLFCAVAASYATCGTPAEQPLMVELESLAA